jgi:hypothetical protein
MHSLIYIILDLRIICAVGISNYGLLISIKSHVVTNVWIVQPIYSTYYGGSGDETAYAGIGGATYYIVGQTSSNNFPMMGAIQPTLNGTMDGFLLALNLDRTCLFSSA